LALSDPYTGEPLHESTGDPEDDPANYHENAGYRAGKRFILNTGDAEQNENWIKSCLKPDSIAISQSNGDFKILCPFHSDCDPSCSVSPKKNCFYCFGCKEKGTLTKLAMQLQGISKGEAITRRVTVAGSGAEYQAPDSHAEAIFEYRDTKGNLIKQRLRYAGKRFVQRRPSGNGWIWNVKGIRPMLYNLLLLEHASIVCITEGEKDADGVMGVKLRDSRYGTQLIGTTTGGAGSWL